MTSANFQHPPQAALALRCREGRVAAERGGRLAPGSLGHEPDRQGGSAKALSTTISTLPGGSADSDAIAEDRKEISAC